MEAPEIQHSPGLHKLRPCKRTKQRWYSSLLFLSMKALGACQSGAKVQRHPDVEGTGRSMAVGTVRRLSQMLDKSLLSSETPTTPGPGFPE